MVFGTRDHSHQAGRNWAGRGRLSRGGGPAELTVGRVFG